MSPNPVLGLYVESEAWDTKGLRLPTPLEELRGRGVLDHRCEADRDLLYTREKHLKHQMRAIASGALTAR